MGSAIAVRNVVVVVPTFNDRPGDGLQDPPELRLVAHGAIRGNGVKEMVAVDCEATRSQPGPG
jgi:hypothetical protein